MLISTLYNHKGGVSKTTSIFNLGYALADSGYKVLLVDADPQCNLTELFMGPILDKIDEASTDTEIVNAPGTSILDALKPRFSGESKNVDIDSIELVSSPFSERILLFKGDVDLSLAEDEFSQAHIHRFTTSMHYKFTYIAFSDMIHRLGKKINADFILIDVGPSAGSLTRTCFLACDCFFVPMAPDRFNYQASMSLSQTIDKWIKEHRQIYDEFLSLGLPTPDGRPLFLGTIIQNFKTFRGSAKFGFEMWMNKITGKLVETLIPTLEKYSDDNKNLLQVCQEFGSVEAAKIPEFGSLVTVMQEFSKPIYNIEKSETAAITSNQVPYQGATWTHAKTKMTELRDIFRELEKRLEKANEIIGDAE